MSEALPYQQWANMHYSRKHPLLHQKAIVYTNKIRNMLLGEGECAYCVFHQCMLHSAGTLGRVGGAQYRYVELCSVLSRVSRLA